MLCAHQHHVMLAVTEPPHDLDSSQRLSVLYAAFVAPALEHLEAVCEGG